MKIDAIIWKEKFIQKIEKKHHVTIDEVEGDMNMVKKKEPIPDYFNDDDDDEEAGNFWDTHSAADYWDEMEEVEVNYPRINAEASCFNEGLLSDTEELPSPQASIRAIPALLRNVLVSLGQCRNVS